VSTQAKNLPPLQQAAAAQASNAPQQFADRSQQLATPPQQFSAQQQQQQQQQQQLTVPQQIAAAPQQTASAPQQVSAAPPQMAATPNSSSNEQLVIQQFGSSQNGMLPQARQLSDQALRMFNSGLSEAGIAMFEDAHRLAPDDAAVTANLGASYGIMAGNAADQHDYNTATSYYQKALPLLEKASSQNLKIVLRRYCQTLRQTNHNEDAQALEAKLNSLNSK
jgi:hypothetical protein